MVSIAFKIELLTDNLGSLHMWSATVWSLALQKAPRRLTTPWVLYWLPPNDTHFCALSWEHWRGYPTFGQLETQYLPFERSFGFAKYTYGWLGWSYAQVFPSSFVGKLA